MVQATFGLEDIESVDDLNDVDNTNKANGKVLVYRSASGNLEYETPSGGGGGADVKSGVATNIDSLVLGTITFATAFASAPSVVVSWEASALRETKKYHITNVTTAQFQILYEEKQGQHIDIHWIATDAGNS